MRLAAPGFFGENIMGIDCEMFVRTKAKVTSKEVLTKAYYLASAFGRERFWIWHDWDEGPRHCLQIVKSYEQDGPTIHPKKGETLIRCYIATRYYGVDYARGDYPLIKAVAEWLEVHFPKSEIWYGGDSSGVLASRFDAAAREFLWKYFCSEHNSYDSYFNDGQELLCSWCKMPMMCSIWYGGGSRAHGWTCPGCGELAYQHESGTVKRFREKEEQEKYAEVNRIK